MHKKKAYIGTEKQPLYAHETTEKGTLYLLGQEGHWKQFHTCLVKQTALLGDGAYRLEIISCQVHQTFWEGALIISNR